MRIQKVAFRNFGAFGNKYQELVFDQPAKLYMLIGRNGSGKTTILDIITFAIYGKLSTKKLKTIPNRKNKATFTKIWLRTNKGVDLVIERGLEPNKFDLYIGGILYDKAGKKEVQDFLENELLEIPFNVFNNIISLSINDFRSFIKLSPTDKRSIIDKIFGIYVVNAMRDLMKIDAKRNKELYEKHQTETQFALETLEKTKSRRDELVSRLEADYSEQLTTIDSVISELLELQKSVLDDLNNAELRQKKSEEKYSIVQDEFTKIKYMLDECNRGLDLYNNSTCPTCGSILTGNEHIHKQTTLSNERTHYEIQLETYKQLILDVRHSMEQDKKNYLEIWKKCHDIEENIRIRREEKTQLNMLKQKHGEVREFDILIQDQTKMFKDSRTLSVKTQKRDLIFKTIEEILGENGIKKYIFETLLPLINSEIEQLLSELDFPYVLKFDTEFNASIYDLGVQIEPDTLSLGESKKADICIILSIIKMLKIKMPALNILVLDELFSSLDAESVRQVIKMLKRIMSELDMNTIVINHVPLPTEKFDCIVTVNKVNGYSDLCIQKL